MSVPAHPKVYHIVHVDRLASILRDGGLYCDAYVSRNALPGTTIGMSGIKARRLSHPLTSYPDLHVGDCVPFYFCPRSVMLYMISRGNAQGLTYRGGQQPIVHLAANLRDVVDWAEARNKRWVFTTTNAGSAFFDDYNTWDQLSEIDWDAVHATKWSGEDVPPRVKEGKQAAVLLEAFCRWEVFKCIFVYSESYYRQVEALLTSIPHKPKIQVQPRFYY